MPYPVNFYAGTGTKPGFSFGFGLFTLTFSMKKPMSDLRRGLDDCDSYTGCSGGLITVDGVRMGSGVGSRFYGYILGGTTISDTAGIGSCLCRGIASEKSGLSCCCSSLTKSGSNGSLNCFLSLFSLVYTREGSGYISLIGHSDAGSLSKTSCICGCGSYGNG